MKQDSEAVVSSAVDKSPRLFCHSCFQSSLERALPAPQSSSNCTLTAFAEGVEAVVKASRACSKLYRCVTNGFRSINPSDTSMIAFGYVSWYRN